MPSDLLSVSSHAIEFESASDASTPETAESEGAAILPGPLFERVDDQFIFA